MRKAAATPPGTPTMKMKLLIDTGAQRVLFAEGGKNVIDFIFSILAMPISAILKLLVADDDADAFGCVANLYASVEKMDDAHMQCKNARDVLLADPGSGSAPESDDDHGYASYSAPPPPKTVMDLLSPPKYACMAGCCSTDYSRRREPRRGYVKGVSMYTIMDDLTVAPASSMLLSKLDVKDLTGLEERTVNIGSKEGLEIVTATLNSKAILTDVFLAKKKRARTDSKHGL
ncbi:hypothetical protein PR202_ga23427 [Eleusine coracana subsp. coracana]|uniref:Peptidase A2 domain-containing protein n=1 Tax=Eleusine coracana subsp. coracana TaxID=191504 RepID=A0AAV5D5T3_ELECO|nr:hypothetical protein PR202_ga23427 [Eleusine coracana subsp. coracana]